MDKRINKKIEAYISELKENVRDKATTLGLTNDANVAHIVQYIYDYERLNLTKEDFMKRKRVKNVVHLADRCCAKRANGEQCTRRRRDEVTAYCGTHLKGTPHGTYEMGEQQPAQGQKVEVWAQDIMGIVYYIDKNNNVYQTEDIMYGKTNPKVIAKYCKIGETYSIPEFNI
jgi:hypothetical protein